MIELHVQELGGFGTSQSTLAGGTAQQKAFIFYDLEIDSPNRPSTALGI